MATELATAYVSLSANTKPLANDLKAFFKDLDAQGARAGKGVADNVNREMSRGSTAGASNLGKRLNDTLSNSTKGAGTKAVSQFQSEAEARGAKVGEIVGTVLGKGIGFAIKGSMAVAAAGAAVAIGGLTASLTKGFTRLKNIDAATFKLKALGNSASDVKAIMNSALDSVKGTAFGLDSAANAAATAVAAGIPQGKDLTDYLKNVADAAAIAQTSMDEMGSIFNKVQTNGKAMTDDLQMLADRGLPIFTWLQQQYGVTGDALQKMVEDGKVSAADFQKAIHDHIGGAALKMGQSFQGSIDNLNAAMGRLGAALIGTPFENASGAIGSLTGALDNLGSWLSQHKQGVITFWEDLGQAAVYTGGAIMDFTSGTLRAMGLWINGMSQPLKLSLNLFGDWAKGLGKILAAIPGMKDLGADLQAAGIYTQTYADVVGTVDDTLGSMADQIDRASDSFAKNHEKITKWADKARDAATVSDALGDSFVKINEDGHIEVESNAMDKIQELNDLGLVVKNLPDGQFEVIAGTPEAQALVDAFVAKNSTLPPAKLPVDVDTSAAVAKLNALYNDIFKAPPGAVAPSTGGTAGSLILPGGYSDYDPARLAQRPSFGGGREDGGAITGPGPKGKDSVLMWGAPGEHVFTDKEVDALGGQAGAYAFRSALRGGRIPAFSDGGAVGAIDAAYNNSGKPYNYGPWDCSMYASYIYAGMAGLPPGRYFTTESDFAAMGFKKGYKPGALNIGVRSGAGMNSHMAVTLPNGINAENAGNGSVYGPGAAGAQDFPTQWYYDGPSLTGDMGALQAQTMNGGSGVDPNTTIHGQAMGAAPGPAATGSTVDPASTAGRTQGYIPAGAGNASVAGTSFLSGLYNMGAGVINQLIDQAGSAAGTAASLAIAGGSMGAGAAGGSQAGAAAAQFAIGLGTQAAKRGVQYGAQMAGIWTDALIEQLTPFGAPRWISTDPTAFLPQPLLDAATTSIEKGFAGQNASDPVQPGQLPGTQTPGQPAPAAQPGGVGAPSIAGAPTIADAVGAQAQHYQPLTSQHLTDPALTPPPQPKQPTGPTQQPDDAAQSPWDPRRLFGFDQGGWLEPGMVGANFSRKPEPVFTGEQFRNIDRLAGEMATAAPSGGGPDFSVRMENVYTNNPDELERTLTRRQSRNMMRYAGRPSTTG